MKPSLARARPLPCGCIVLQGVRARLCPEALRLWARVEVHGADPVHERPEYKEYQAHFKRRKVR